MVKRWTRRAIQRERARARRAKETPAYVTIKHQDPGPGRHVGYWGKNIGQWRVRVERIGPSPGYFSKRRSWFASTWIGDFGKVDASYHRTFRGAKRSALQAQRKQAAGLRLDIERSGRDKKGRFLRGYR